MFDTYDKILPVPVLNPTTRLKLNAENSIVRATLPFHADENSLQGGGGGGGGPKALDHLKRVSLLKLSLLVDQQSNMTHMDPIAQ